MGTNDFGILFVAVVKMASLAGIEQIAALFKERVDVFGFSGLVHRVAGFAQSPGAIHPAALVFGAALHHQ